MSAVKTKKPAKKKRKSKGKQHPVHATSLHNVADKLHELANNSSVDCESPRAVVRLIANVFKHEGKRVQKIVR